jgi:hypothetical protein
MDEDLARVSCCIVALEGLQNPMIRAALRSRFALRDFSNLRLCPSVMSFAAAMSISTLLNRRLDSRYPTKLP